ncbi:MAG: putative toxin-antitoxin system toxin component, PIN family, partial [Deltaproteobacteria bacterium]
LCAEIFEVCLLEHTVIMSEQIFSEVKENLIKKVHIPKGVVQNIMRYLEDIAETVLPEQVDASVCRDKNDVGIIGTAISGNARFIITGDNDLLRIRKHKGIEIINPRGFWSLLRQGVNK